MGTRVAGILGGFGFEGNLVVQKLQASKNNPGPKPPKPLTRNPKP